MNIFTSFYLTFKYYPYFRFLRKLLNTLKRTSEKLQQIPISDPGSHRAITTFYLLWLHDQIKGIITLLRLGLVTQAELLNRTLWEAKVNLTCMAKSEKPNELSKSFWEEISINLEKLRKQAELENPNIPSVLSRIQPRKTSSNFQAPKWKWRVKDRAAVDAELIDEYNSIYGVYSNETHLSASALTNYMRFNGNKAIFPSKRSWETVPDNSMIASWFAFQVLGEINNVLGLLENKTINSIGSELKELEARFLKQNQKVGKNLPDLINNLNELSKGGSR